MCRQSLRVEKRILPTLHGLRYTTALMQLQDCKRTKVIIVTLAESTPLLEAANLQSDLERAGIHPWAWVINNSIAATATHARIEPLTLRQRARNELPQIAAVARRLSQRYAVVPPCCPKSRLVSSDS